MVVSTVFETRCTFTRFSRLFVTDDAEATPGPDKRTDVLAAIGEWEDAFDSEAPSVSAT